MKILRQKHKKRHKNGKYSRQMENSDFPIGNCNHDQQPLPFPLSLSGATICKWKPESETAYFQHDSDGSIM